MPSAYCHYCQENRNMSVNVYRTEEINQDGDKTLTETKSFLCETCNIFINSEDTIANELRHSKIDRRSKHASVDRKHEYKGPERRSGSERRIWIDRIDEIHSKVK